MWMAEPYSRCLYIYINCHIHLHHWQCTVLPQPGTHRIAFQCCSHPTGKHAGLPGSPHPGHVIYTKIVSCVHCRACIPHRCSSTPPRPPKPRKTVLKSAILPGHASLPNPSSLGNKYKQHEQAVCTPLPSTSPQREGCCRQRLKPGAADPCFWCSQAGVQFPMLQGVVHSPQTRISQGLNSRSGHICSCPTGGSVSAEYCCTSAVLATGRMLAARSSEARGCSPAFAGAVQSTARPAAQYSCAHSAKLSGLSFSPLGTSAAVGRAWLAVTRAAQHAGPEALVRAGQLCCSRARPRACASHRSSRFTRWPRKTAQGAASLPGLRRRPLQPLLCLALLEGVCCSHERASPASAPAPGTPPGALAPASGLRSRRQQISRTPPGLRTLRPPPPRSPSRARSHAYASVASCRMKPALGHAPARALRTSASASPSRRPSSCAQAGAGFGGCRSTAAACS